MESMLLLLLLFAAAAAAAAAAALQYARTFCNYLVHQCVSKPIDMIEFDTTNPSSGLK